MMEKPSSKPALRGLKAIRSRASENRHQKETRVARAVSTVAGKPQKVVHAAGRVASVSRMRGSQAAGHAAKGITARLESHPLSDM